VSFSTSAAAYGEADDPHQRARAMRRAWEEFFVSGTVLPWVRPAIAESWQRSRELGISPTLHTRPLDERGIDRLLHSDLRRLLIRASNDVLDRMVDITDGSSLSFTLTDADGLVLERRGSPMHLAQDERIGVQRGTRWAELDVGTNGIGTALTRRQTMRVFAAEHYCETFHSTTCTAALIRDPVTRQPIGVFDITSDFAENASNVWALALHAGSLIESEIQHLLLSSGERLLETAATQQQDQAAYVVDLECRNTIANRAAVALLAPDDYASLWPFVRRSVQEGDERVVPHVLKSGKPVVVEVTVVRLREEPVGALVVLRDNHRQRGASTPPVASPPAEDWRPFNASAPWLVVARASLHSREPVLVVGESGSGKSTLAAALQRNLGDGTPHSIDCVSLDDWSRFARVLDESSHRTVLLERLLDLKPGLQARLVAWLDRRGADDGPRVIATACVDDELALRSSGLRRDLVDRLAVHVIRVPPLRERADDIEAIALELIQERTHGRGYVTQPVSKEALSVLRGYAWPGNVRQLQNVLLRVLLVHTHGEIGVGALPPDIVLGAAEPRLGLIEQVEGEAILRTLQSTGGNVSKAALVMGLSRATVYRRLHAYRAQRRSSGGNSNLAHY
jgi:sigma-54 dependent transcriptional regulator, acetoin dehydrogenase operon transcriptional activator AcoR